MRKPTADAMNRYLQETGAFKASEKLVEVAFSNCADRDSLAYAYLIDTAGTVHDRQGHVATALAFYRDALRIHLKESPLGSVEVANAYSAVGNGFTGLWRASEGIEYAMYAIQNSPTDRDEKIKWNPDRYLRNRARSYFIDGQFEKSKADLEEAEYWQSLIHGEDSHYHGEYVLSDNRNSYCFEFL
jgi:tetratricopeptide (TPR) repeat protein